MNQYAQAESQHNTTHLADHVSVTRDVSLILVERQAMGHMHDIAGRTFLAMARTSANVLLISQSSAQGNFCFVVPRESVACVIESISAELSLEIARRQVVAIHALEDVVILTARINGCGAGAGLCDKLADAQINILVCAQGSTSVSTVIAAADAQRAIRLLN